MTTALPLDLRVCPNQPQNLLWNPEEKIIKDRWRRGDKLEKEERKEIV